jgi:hypothetical protein
MPSFEKTLMAFLGQNKNCGDLVGSCIRQGGEEDPGIKQAPRSV